MGIDCEPNCSVSLDDRRSRNHYVFRIIFCRNIQTRVRHRAWDIFPGDSFPKLIGNLPVVTANTILYRYFWPVLIYSTDTSRNTAEMDLKNRPLLTVLE